MNGDPELGLEPRASLSRSGSLGGKRKTSETKDSESVDSENSSEDSREEGGKCLRTCSLCNPCCCRCCSFVGCCIFIAISEMCWAVQGIYAGDPHGYCSLLAGLILLGVCIYAKFKPDKPKTASLILAILCWVSAGLQLAYIVLALYSIIIAWIAKNTADKFLKAADDGFGALGGGALGGGGFGGVGISGPGSIVSGSVGTFLIIITVLIVLGCLFSIYFIICTCVLGCKFLAERKKFTDEEDDDD